MVEKKDENGGGLEKKTRKEQIFLTPTGRSWAT